ncbi:hypothetical protein Tco_1121222 [Tanacetum coccineum]|uniref:Uncharacterized protein n=1 Tax=Tanacetum coccineum TaxID=301880 RepID=A0ABQ5IX31_9ASTR
MQVEEQEKLSIKEKSKLFVQLLEARKKHFAAMRAQEKRNKPPTIAQKRKTMSTYLKNMAGYNHNQLKNKIFNDIQKLFDKAMKRVNTFVDIDTELVEDSKQKVDEDRETTKLQSLVEVIPDKEEVVVDAIPLATKPSSIVDFMIHRVGKQDYYQITIADGSSKMYLVFSQLLKSFDREDLETLWRLVKAKHGYTRLEEDYKRVLWGDLKGRIVGIKRLLDDLRVTTDKVCVTAAKLNTARVKLVLLVRIEENILSSYAACTQLMLLVYKLLLLVFRVNAAGTKLKLLKELRLLKEFMLSEKR